MLDETKKKSLLKSFENEECDVIINPEYQDIDITWKQSADKFDDIKENIKNWKDIFNVIEKHLLDDKTIVLVGKFNYTSKEAIEYSKEVQELFYNHPILYIAHPILNDEGELYRWLCLRISE